MDSRESITGRQIAAARALTGLSQRDVARMANISVPTLKRMEGAKDDPVSGMINNIAAVKAALETAGVEFIEGTGVRLGKPA
jgi:transcriptional regulator with XRE-family HTH domain